ncbi:probable serine/threonine-protein kinase PIX13 [Magnolia sinica]|uniref:probable serine/threonine-protein kinase PIX13 n=1 Tax=Magnolia sinica TaxID=86752 RepID=UPI00265977B0|nr:probable serine/threonine-protein kinase PIX13 [Magnolia sinica]
MGNCMNCMQTLVKSSQTPTTTRQSSPVTSMNNSSEGRFSGSRNRHSSSIDEVFPEGQIIPTPNLRIFTFAELKSATRNFRSDTVLGDGGFRRVFKGWINEKTLAPSGVGCGTVIAVKKLNSGSQQSLQEWKSEVNFLGRLSHPNIVKLIGSCWEGKDLFLVYEFMPKGSLENHLFRRGLAIQVLSWSIRLKIAIGVAKGLAFLHTSETQVIFRNLKASTILLDSNYNSKITNFGLAKNGPLDGNSHVTTRVMGTYGYVAPEYVATGNLYVKSDVYSFGVVLLEILSGQRVLDRNRPRGQQNLVDWAKPYLFNQRKLSKVMDPQIEGQYSSKGALQAAQLTLKCLESDPRSRPSMKEVVEALEQIQAIKDKPKESKSSAAATLTAGHNHSHHRSFSRSPIHLNNDGATAPAARQLSSRRSR